MKCVLLLGLYRTCPVPLKMSPTPLIEVNTLNRVGLTAFTAWSRLDHFSKPILAPSDTIISQTNMMNYQ